MRTFDDSSADSAASHPFGAKELALLVAIGSILGVVAIRFDAIPVVLAGVVGVAVPVRRNVGVRLALGAFAALTALLLVRLWPDLDAIELPPAEPRQLLSWLIGLPLAGSVAVLLVPHRAERVLRIATIGVMLTTLAASMLLLRIDMGRAFHCNQDIVWIARYGIHYHVAVDGVSVWLVLLTTFMAPIATVASFGSIQTRTKAWCFVLLLLEAGVIGSFAGPRLVCFLHLLGADAGADVRHDWRLGRREPHSRSAQVLSVYDGRVDADARRHSLPGLRVFQSQRTGTPSFDYFELQRLHAAEARSNWIWAAFTVAFLVKVPMFPLHTWLPDAHTEAPTAGSVLLAAVMLKLGTYGYLRFSVGLFPLVCGVCGEPGRPRGRWWNPLRRPLRLETRGCQTADCLFVDISPRLCHARTVRSQCNVDRRWRSPDGQSWHQHGHAILALWRHLRSASHAASRRIWRPGKPMPLFATLFFVATLASIGLPATNGFVGEFMVLTGTFNSRMLGHFSGVQAVVAASGVVLGAVYMLMVVEKMFFGPVTREENRSLSDLNHRELIAALSARDDGLRHGAFPGGVRVANKGSRRTDAGGRRRRL